MGIALTPYDIKSKALELIAPENPNFKASDSWLEAFLNRHHLSVRQMNTKDRVQEDENLEIAQCQERIQKCLSSQIVGIYQQNSPSCSYQDSKLSKFHYQRIYRGWIYR